MRSPPVVVLGFGDLVRGVGSAFLLHRVSDPARQICIEGWQQKAADLHELQDLLWPI